jgi:UDP-N-acetyl-D-mannosaminuronate dehydrogenase
MKQTDVVVGMGEIGSAFYQVLRKGGVEVYGFDIEKEKCKGKEPTKADVLHICIPFCEYDSFKEVVAKYFLKFEPKEIIIHSSVEPETTEKIKHLCCESIVVYSPFRGVHSRISFDMIRYTKYWAGDKEPELFIDEMRRAKVKIEPWNDTSTSLELAKLLMDVTYYGWLIIFAQHVKVEADRYGVDEKKLWLFTEEIHKYLGNRPRMFSGKGIGGHCVMQDKALLNDSFLDAVFSYDEFYRRNLKNDRS